MDEARIREIVRQFPENGIKLLLENPRNLEELLRLAGLKLVDRIDFAKLRPAGTTFVQQDFRHVESDLVLVAPLKRRGNTSRSSVTVYILIEHQTRPERHMLLRVLEYVVESYRTQSRE